MSFEQFQAEVGATLLQVQQGLTAVQQTQQQQGQILAELQQRQMEQAAAAVQQPTDVQGDGMLFGGGQGGLPPQAPEVREQVPRTTLKNPDVFTGVREKAERWCTDMDDWFVNAQTAPERQLGLAKSYLSPELKDWFDLVKLEDGIGFCDWPALKDTLLRRYRDKHVRRAAKKKIAILRCTGTVSDYNNKFDVEALKLKKAGTSEWDLLDSYIEGLPPAVMFQTDRQEPQTLQEAMEKALDNKAWLQQASARGGKWAKGAGPIPGGFPPIDPTGPAPMELCGVRRGMPLCDPRLPQTLWEERWRRGLCLQCGDPNHQMRQCWNGLRGPPQARAMYTSPFGGWREPPQRVAWFPEFRRESSPPRRYYEGARYPSPSGSPSASGGREETRQPGKGFGSNVPSGGQGRTFSDTPSFGRRTSSPPRGSQPARRVGPRRVAGVRTIPGRREDDRVVVLREPEVFDPYEMSDGGEGEWETGRYG